MSASPLWLVNSNGNVFTLSTRHDRFRQLVKTYQDGIKLKRVAAFQNGAWGVGNDHHVYIFIHHSEVPIRVQEAAYENQRWSPVSGFSCNNLLPTDRRDWSDENGNGFRPRESFELPSEHWKWDDNEWEIDDNFHGQIASRGGWQYAVNFSRKWTPESRWNSCVRKRKWIRFRRFIATNLWAKISDNKLNVSADCFIDLAVGGFDIPSQPKGHLCVWAVGNNGQVYARLGVTHDCPEGKEWCPVSTGSHGLINIVTGPTGLTWGVTWDGQCLVRLGVDREHVYGRSWTIVSYPDSSTRVMQLALGLNALWALSREGKVWYRKGIQGTQLLTAETATGSTWIAMYGEMAHIAITPTDQVFAIGLNDKEMYFRTGVSSSDLGGKTWQILSLKENTAVLQNDSFASLMSDSMTESEFEESQGLGSSSSQGTVLTRASSVASEPRGGTDVHRISGDTEMNLSGMISAAHQMQPATLIQKSGLKEVDVTSLPHQVVEEAPTNWTQRDDSLNITLTRLVQSDTETENENRDIPKNIHQNNQDAKLDCDIPKNNTHVTDKEVEEQTKDEDSDTNIGDDIFRELGLEVQITSNVEIKVTPTEEESVGSEKPVDLNLGNTSRDTIDSLGSSLKSDSDMICNFVTDLLSSSSMTEEASSPDPFVEDDVKTENNVAKRPDTLETSDTSEKRENVKAESPMSDVFVSPESETSIPWTTMKSSTAVSGTISVRITPSFDQDSMPWFEMVPAMPRYCWAWISGMACVFEDTGKISWLQERMDGDSICEKRSKYQAKISMVLRDAILKNLQARNIREIENFKYIDTAIQRSSWLKKGSMKWYKFGSRPQWMDCSVEVEQGQGSSEEGYITLHYVFRANQMHSQICIQDIVCIRRLNDVSEKSAFVVYTADTVKTMQPWILKAASETDAEDWVSLLCAINSTKWKSTETIPAGSFWSTTQRGDVYVHRPDETDVKGYEMCWTRHGGHLKVVETAPCGVVWGISYDNTAYVYNGGYGGGVFKATSHLSRNVVMQSDLRNISVHEADVWYPVIGYSSQGFLTGGCGWGGQGEKRYDKKEEIPLPSSRWQWITSWKVDFDVEGGADNDGWQYSTNFKKPFHPSIRLRDSVRRRKWKRKCRLETLGPWDACQSVPITDVSIQIEPVTSTCEPILLWAVAANGNVLTRFGVTSENPQGESWIHVTTDQPFRAVSVGGSCRVWAIAKEGSAWYRPGVTQYNISGTCWLQVVPPLPAGCLLKQISVGMTAVWAVDSKGNLWHREEITETFPEGTRWTLVSSHVEWVSVGLQDQVWIVAGANFMKNKQGAGVLYRRLGITDSCQTGNGWEAIIGSGWKHVCIRGEMERKVSTSDDPKKEPL